MARGILFCCLALGLLAVAIWSALAGEWVIALAAAAVSLDDAEAARLASFLQGTTTPAERQSLLERLARR